ncbi:hypothetical protein T01_15969 [Trichinella spiralis]|uniref:Uncharacterized protein n=1 Tax=Trichinella spiralis TaxID=6334 RepID=A0A0V1B8K4_TRISP|nr:hypothetical protein T01_15969 [Trichinella spiralis]
MDDTSLAAKSELEKLKEIELDRHVIGTIDKNDQSKENLQKFPETGSIMQITIIIKMPYHQQRCACLFDIRGRCEQWKKVIFEFSNSPFLIGRIQQYIYSVRIVKWLRLEFIFSQKF